MQLDPPCLEVRDLTVSYPSGTKRFAAVDGVSFSLRSGETLALIGESGSGKSATAWAVLRLIQEPGRVDRGAVLFRSGHEPALDFLALRENDQRLYQLRGSFCAMIFQEPQAALSPVHTIGAQLIEGLQVHRKLARKQAEAEVAELLSQLDMPQPALRMKQYPHELSGGMRQRAVIAMALVGQPQLLIADEPTTALDDKMQMRVLQMFRRHKEQRGMALLLITHDLTAVAEAAANIAVMYCGRIVEQGSTRDVMTKPRHPYTRALLNSYPQDGVRKPHARLPTIPGEVPRRDALPTGCRFHPRCGEAVPGICDASSGPQLQRVAPGHLVACFMAAESAYG